MAILSVNGSQLGNSLNDLLTAAEIVPGDAPSYQLCKTIYSFHPLGAKMVEAPIRIAQSQKREIRVPDSPGEAVVKAFEEEWEKIGADEHIFNVRALSRVYGIASIALLTEGEDFAKPVDFKNLSKATIGFNVYDPLNTSGSLVLNQDPLSIDFQKVVTISVSGKPFHRTRSLVLMNERPLYIEYTNSAFGYVGRSVYQRALFPLKSFIQSMVTDDMVTKKAGLLIAFIKQAGSIIDGIMARVTGIKRALLQSGVTNNVLSMGNEDKVESLNLMNVDGASSAARKNVLENIAAADDMPAVILNSETFAEGFGEGTEDAKKVAQYVDRERRTMRPAYSFFDDVVMYRAWNDDFLDGLRNKFPEQYGKITNEQLFIRFKNSFTATWPSLLKEPDSEQVKVEDVKLRAIIALVEILLPVCLGENRAALIQWAADNFNELELMFGAPLVLDYEELATAPTVAVDEPKPNAPFSAKDELYAAVARLPDRTRASAREIALRVRETMEMRKAANG
jgi:hypothetical protein